MSIALYVAGYYAVATVVFGLSCFYAPIIDLDETDNVGYEPG
jgi:hypothetical protein